MSSAVYTRARALYSLRIVSELRQNSARAARILVSDFDGTMSRFDFYDLVRKHWPVPPEDDPWDQYVAGRMTHFEALAAIFARIPADEDEVLKVVDSMELDPRLAEAVARLQEHGWKVVVASAGCQWYIDYLLKKAGVSVEVHANPGVFVKGKGLRMSLPEESAFFKRSTGIDKVGIVRAALREGGEVGFVGDGRPDLEAALLVSPTRRFARGWLAEELRAKGEAYHPFGTWSQIVPQLLG